MYPVMSPRGSYLIVNGPDVTKIVSILDSCICVEQVNTFYEWQKRIGNISPDGGLELYVWIPVEGNRFLRLTELCSIKTNQIVAEDFDNLVDSIVKGALPC